MRTRNHHKTRLRTLAIVAATAAAAAFAGLADVDAASPLADQIGHAISLEIRADSLVWIGPSPEPSLATAVGSRELAFLASKGRGAPADLYRAEVAIAPGPRVVSIDGLRNLTESEDGDDFAVAAAWPHIAVVTRALGQVRSITVFDVRGQPLPRDGSLNAVQRVLARLTDLQQTGRAAGIGRTSVRFERPPAAVELSFGDGDGRKELVLAWTDRDGANRLASVDLVDGRTASGELVVTAETRLPKRPVLWAVDTMRAISWIGPGPLEWAEGRFFALKDRLHRWEYALFGDEDDAEGGDDGDQAGGETTASGMGARAARALPKPPPGLEIGADVARIEWPPPPVQPPAFKSRKRGEGEWIPATPDFVRSFPGAPPSVYRTFVRSDIERPYVRVELLAMDMRQLDLRMVGGQEDPRPTTGTTGAGQIPRDRSTLERFVAAFNGAFKTEHGAYGMMVERNVLLPPQDDAATVATYADGRVAMGSWPKGEPIPQEMMSYRQNMDPLVEDGVVNPRKRRLWGYTLGADLSNMNTIRSGMCLTANGTMIYAWGDELTAKTLGIAMNAAGCVYAIHLDMNPYHTAYIFYRFEELEKEIDHPKFESQLVFPAMLYSPWRYVNGAPKDFFFVALKDILPPGEDWSAERIAQPAPAFLPAAFRKRVGGLDVLAFDVRRLRARLEPGDVPAELDAEPGNAGEPDRDLLAEVGLGGFSASRGLMAKGGVIAALAKNRATLVLRDGGAVEVAPWSDDRAVDDAVQGEWLLRGGAGMEGTGDVVGVGPADDGRFVYVASGSFAAVAGVLRDAGASNAIAFPLDPGRGAPTAVRGENGWLAADVTSPAERDIAEARLRFETAVVPAKALRLGVDAAPVGGKI